MSAPTRPYQGASGASQESLTLTVPMPPNLANGRIHHMVKHKAKVGFWALCDMLHGHGYDHDAISTVAHMTDRMHGTTPLRSEISRMVTVALDLYGQQHRTTWPRREGPMPRWARASIRSMMYLGCAMDDGNAMNRHKWVEDWLVTRGYIADDKKKCLTWEGFPEQVIKRDGNYRIVLTLTPLPSTPAPGASHG